MRKKKRTHVSHQSDKQSQKGFISNTDKKSMNKNEKIIMGVLVGGIVILIVFIFIFFLKGGGTGGKNVFNLPTFTPTPTTQPPYPTIPPVINITVLVHTRLFNPDNDQIPRGGYVDFLNIDSEPITIEAIDKQSEILNIGTIEPGETKQVTFNTPGTYMYRNKDKPTVTGKIVIK